MSQKPPRFLCGALRQRKVKIDRRLIQNPAYGPVVHITAAQTNLLIPSCLQFPDIFKSRTAVLVRITFTVLVIQIDREQGEHFAFRLKLPACWVNRMQVQPTLPPIISDPVRHLP